MNPKKKQDQVKSKSVFESKGLDNRGNGTLIEELIADLASHNDSVRVKARHSLVAMGRIAVSPMVQALKNKSNLVRWEITKALGETGDPETVPALIKALEDEEFDVRWLAAEGLIRMNINALKPLLQALENSGDSILLQEGAHHVFHDLAKGALRKFLVPVLTALERLEPGTEVPWVARHDMGVEVPLAARQALNLLEKTKTI
jgi:hypothetical protein